MKLVQSYVADYGVPTGVYPSLGERGNYVSELYGNFRTNFKNTYEGLERTANWIFDRKHPYRATGILVGLGGLIAGAVMFAGLGILAISAIALTTTVGAVAYGFPAFLYNQIWQKEDSVGKKTWQRFKENISKTEK